MEEFDDNPVTSLKALQAQVVGYSIYLTIKERDELKKLIDWTFTCQIAYGPVKPIPELVSILEKLK